MLRKFAWAVACACLVTGPALAQSNWTGNVNDDWSNAGNWDNGVPSSAANLRARIKKTTDSGNWPVIKSGSTITQGGRIQAPFDAAAPASGLTTYSRLTIESNATLNVNDDFLFGENNGTATEPIIGSLNVAGNVNVNERMRFGHNQFMTLDVDVTGFMKQTISTLDFRIATGANSVVDFDISGSGMVEVPGPFEIGSGGLLSLSGNGKLRLIEYTPEGQPTVTKANLISLMQGFANAGRVEGLTGNYSGGQSLTYLGNGIGYYQDTNSVSFVSIPEPSALCLLTLAALAWVRRGRRRI
jgi:hypothetical protein